MLTIALCSVFFSLMLMLEPSYEPEPGDFYYFSDNSLVVLEAEKGLSFVFDSDTVIHAENAVECVATDVYNTCAIYYDENNTLFFVNKKGYTQISKDVEKAILSSEGDFIVYVSSSDTPTDSLYRYDISKNTSLLIEKSAHFSKTTDIILSPDGETFVYGKNFGLGNDDDIYVSVKGKAGTLVENVENVCCISNDATNVLWHTDDGKYYLRYLESDISFGTVMSDTVMTNKNCSEFVFSNSSGGAYIVKDGKTEKISDDVLIDLYLPTYALHGYGHTRMINKFSEKVFLASSDGLAPYNPCSLNKKYVSDLFENVLILKNNYVSYNLSTIYYVNYGQLMKLNIGHPDKSEVLTRNVSADSLLITRDGKYVYFKNFSDNLYRINHGKIELVARDVEKAYLNRDNNVYFYTKSGDIFFTKNSSSATQIELPDTIEEAIILYEDGEVFITSQEKLYSLNEKGLRLLANNLKTTPDAEE